MTTLSREPAATETRFFVLTRNLSIYDAGLPQLRRLSGMISTVKATMHKVVGAMADDLLPPRDLANAAFAVMVWASSKMSAEERDKLLNGFGIAIRDRVSSLPDYRRKVRALAVPRVSNPWSGQQEAQPRHQGLAEHRGRNAVKPLRSGPGMTIEKVALAR